MALTYRNTITGVIVDMPEPSEIVAQAQARAEELMRVGTKKAREEAEAVESNAKWQRIWLTQNLARMDECDKWERYTRPVEAEASDDSPPPKAAAKKAVAPKSEG